MYMYIKTISVNQLRTMKYSNHVAYLYLVNIILNAIGEKLWRNIQAIIKYYAYRVFLLERRPLQDQSVPSIYV